MDGYVLRCYGWVWFARGYRSCVITPVRFIVHMFKMLSIFPEPLMSPAFLVYLFFCTINTFTCFLYNSVFIAHCTFPLYFSNPVMSCLI